MVQDFQDLFSCVKKHINESELFKNYRLINDFMEEVRLRTEAIVKGCQRIDEATNLIAVELPRKGWYISNQETCPDILQLAQLFQQGSSEEIDNYIICNLVDYNLVLLKSFSEKEEIPDYFKNRLLLFMKHHESGDYESATYLGMPLIDEVSEFIYGKDKHFTQKRGKDKPSVAYKTQNSPTLEPFLSLKFVDRIAMIQEDCDPRRLSDENYLNRHAVVHGKMRRKMNIKDSSKCLMTMVFLIYGVDKFEPPKEPICPK